MEIFGPKTNVPEINGHAIKQKTSGENVEKPAIRAMQVKGKNIVSFTSFPDIIDYIAIQMNMSAFK